MDADREALTTDLTDEERPGERNLFVDIRKHPEIVRRADVIDAAIELPARADDVVEHRNQAGRAWRVDGTYHGAVVWTLVHDSQGYPVLRLPAPGEDGRIHVLAGDGIPIGSLPNRAALEALWRASI